MTRMLDRERKFPRAVSAAEFHPPKSRKNPPASPLKTDFTPHVPQTVWCKAVLFAKSVCGVPSLRATILAGVVFLAVVITATLAGSEIDLSKFMPGIAATGNRPLIVVVGHKLMNQGDAPALNVEVTRPRYLLVGTINAGEAVDVPANDFAIQYEWNDGDKLQRETKSFKIGETSRQASIMPPIDSAVMPPGLTASYDPATHLLTVSAERPTEVRVDGFLLRPISRTEKDGADYRYAQANILVIGQDLKRGETTTFEVVFTKPQDFYSIPIYVREPGKPPVYLTVSLSTGGRS